MLRTEARNEKTTHIDKMSTLEMVKIINEENMNSVKAVEAALPEISKAIDVVVDSLNAGGRVFYVGAGTSGRLAVSDAAECAPTYGVSNELFTAIVAGGRDAVFKAQENVEDSKEAGRRDLIAHNITKNDTVIGISASGGASYVYEALNAAREIGASTISISSNKDARISQNTKVAIWADTGAEVITGSTRMKSGNAQKMILNMISTCSMVKTGKVYENLMINLRPTNIKLTARMIGIVRDITGLCEDASKDLLDKNNWNIRAAVESLEKQNQEY